MLLLDGPVLLEARHGHVDGGDELAALERLDQVGGDAGVTRLLDQVALAEGGQDEHRHPVVGGDAPGRLDAVDPRHLDVEDGEVGSVLSHELDRLVAAAGLPHDLVPLGLRGSLSGRDG